MIDIETLRGVVVEMIKDMNVEILNSKSCEERAYHTGQINMLGWVINEIDNH